MEYEVETTELFAKQLKKLAKKYKSLKNDMQRFLDDLSENPHLGAYLGDDTYKIRVAVKSKGKGKSGGLRIIDYVIDSQKLIYLLTIYDKADTDTISQSTIKSYIKEIIDSQNDEENVDDEEE